MDNIHLSTVATSEKFVQFIEIIEAVDDPRLNRRKKHELVSIIVIIIFGMLCGANNATAIRNFGVRVCDKLAQLIDLRNGIPSRSTFSRALFFINPNDLEFWLSYWRSMDEGKSDCKPIPNDDKEVRRDYAHVAMDGKKDKTNKFYCMRAFDVASMCVIKHEEVVGGTNEITAAFELLGKINLRNVIVTADAMHAQKHIVRKIVIGGGDYLLTLKRNHREFYADLQLYFENIEKDPYLAGTYSKCRTTEKSRDRFETRTCISTGDVKWIYRANRWRKLKSISMIVSTRTVKGKTSVHLRYFISSLEPDAKQILSTARGHWAIENLCHGHLDEDFCADRSTVRARRTAMNLSIFKDCALSILVKSDSNESLNEQRISNHYKLESLMERLFLPAFK